MRVGCFCGSFNGSPYRCVRVLDSCEVSVSCMGVNGKPSGQDHKQPSKAQDHEALGANIGNA